MGKADGGGVGFVQSVIDWKCKPESVRRLWGGSSEGEETTSAGGRRERRGGGSEIEGGGEEDRTSALRYEPTDGRWSAPRPRGETRQLGKLLSV